MGKGPQYIPWLPGIKGVRPMADGYSETQQVQQEAEFAPAGRRVMAGVWDILVIGVMTALLFLLAGVNPLEMSLILWLFFLVILGVVHFLLAASLEMARARTIGKYIEGIEVFSLTGEPLTPAQVLGRNASKIFFAAYLIDIAGGSGGQPTQKMSDRGLNTVLIKSMATIYRRTKKRSPWVNMSDRDEALRREIMEALKRGYLEGDEHLDPETRARRLVDYIRASGLPLDGELGEELMKFMKKYGITADGALGKEVERQQMMDYLRHGRCSKCGSPFRILEKGDTSWTGLWNSRCTWCNKLVFEDEHRGRVEPGFKPAGGYSDYRGEGFRAWERESYLEWEKRSGRSRVEPGFKP